MEEDNQQIQPPFTGTGNKLPLAYSLTGDPSNNHISPISSELLLNIDGDADIREKSLSDDNDNEHPPTITTNTATTEISEQSTSIADADVKLPISVSGASADESPPENRRQYAAPSTSCGCCSCLDKFLVAYTLRQIATSRWAPWWLLMSTRFASSAFVLLAVIVHHHPSYFASQIVTYGYAISFVLIGIAPVIYRYFHRKSSRHAGRYGTYATVVGIFHTVLSLFQAYLLVDVVRTLVQWEAWNFVYKYDTYLSGDFLSATLFLLYIVDCLIMQNNIRQSKLYAAIGFALHITVFTAVYSVGAAKREVFRKRPGVAVGIYIALLAAYIALTGAVVGISRLNDCGNEANIDPEE